MKKLSDMSRDELRSLLQKLVAEKLFDAREHLLVLLGEPPSAENEAELVAGFREFYCEYTQLALWLEGYEEDPLYGLEPHAPLTKKLARYRNYILATRKTTLDERMFKRMGLPLEDMPVLNTNGTEPCLQEVRIAELPPAEFRALLRSLVIQELFVVRERLVALLKQQPSCQQLALAFREFFVAYELLELALEGYHYDADEGLEVRPEFLAELDQSVAEVEAGTAELISLEAVAEEFGVTLQCTR